MPSERDRPQWHALLASRLTGLEDLRARIWEQGQRSDAPIWMSEIDAKDQFADKDLDFIQVACLKQVRLAPKFICLLDGSFGTTWNEGQVSILELELATAAFSKRDIWIFLLAPFDQPDPRITSLLKAVEISCPAARINGPLSHEQVLADIARLLEPDGATPETLRVGPLVLDLARKRSPALNFDLAARDVQFLNGAFAPLFDHPPDKDVIDQLIAQWYALHGHFFLGRLAAVNSLSVIRQRMPASMQCKVGPPSIFADAGAAASEYYSIAKLVPSRWQRYRLLRKALWNCNAALSEADSSDPSGLLDIRGHVKLRMLNLLGGMSDLKRALAIRREQGEDGGRIGESEVHLGMAYSYCRQFGKAERLLQDGVAQLRAADNRNFLVQALRHLAVFYAQVGRREEAVRLLREAQAVARQHEIQGQLQQIENELHQLGEAV